MSVRPAAIVLAFAMALIVLAQGASAPFQKDAEPQSAEWVVSVARDRNWLIPRDYYGFADRKPPLYYWLSAIAVRATGGEVDEVRARIVSIVSAAALAVLILVWTAANVGVADGWLSFLFILGMYGFASRATLALTDMLLTVLLFAALAILFPLAGSPLQKGDGSGERSIKRAIGAGAVLGLAILAKGPIALVLVALTVAIFELLERRNPLSMLRERWPWIVAGLALGTGALWYVPWLVVGGRETRMIFLQENAGHFLPRRLGGTGEASRPAWYILARLIGGSLPLVALLPTAILALWASNRARAILVDRFGREGGVIAARTHAITYQASLTLAVVLFFSLASAKRDDYILPALPGIAILCASAVTFVYAAVRYELKWASPIVRLFNWTVIAIAGIMLVALASAVAVAILRLELPVALHSSDAAFLELFLDSFRSPRASALIIAVVVIMAAIAAMIAVARGRVFIAGVAIGALSLAGSLMFCAVLRPELAERRSIRGYVAEIHRQVGGDRLYVVRDDNFELSFYYGEAIPRILGQKADPLSRPSYLLAYQAEVATIPKELQSEMHMRIISSYPLLGREGDAELYRIIPISLNAD